MPLGYPNPPTKPEALRPVAMPAPPPRGAAPAPPPRPPRPRRPARRHGRRRPRRPAPPPARQNVNNAFAHARALGILQPAVAGDAVAEGKISLDPARGHNRGDFTALPAVDAPDVPQFGDINFDLLDRQVGQVAGLDAGGLGGGLDRIADGRIPAIAPSAEAPRKWRREN